MPSARPALPSRTPATSRRPRAAATLLLALVLACVALLGPATGAAASSADVVSRLNGARADAGLAPLQASSDLTAVAQRWAERMAASGELAHNPALADEVGGWSAIAENVGTGADVATVHGVLMGSSGHRANILGGSTQVGAGVASGHGAVWVVQVFRTPSGDAAPAPAPAAPTPAPPAVDPTEEPAPPAVETGPGTEPDEAPAEVPPAEAEETATTGSQADVDARDASRDEVSRSRPVRGHLVALDVVRAAAVRAHDRAVTGPDLGLRGVARVHEPRAV